MGGGMEDCEGLAWWEKCDSDFTSKAMSSGKRRGASCFHLIAFASNSARKDVFKVVGWRTQEG
jgi:hypothetical protein